MINMFAVVFLDFVVLLASFCFLAHSLFTFDIRQSTGELGELGGDDVFSNVPREFFTPREFFFLHLRSSLRLGTLRMEG